MAGSKCGDAMTGQVRGPEYCWSCMAPASAVWAAAVAKPATPEPMGKEVVVAEFDGQRYTRFDRPATQEPPEWKPPSMSLCMNCGQSHVTGNPCSFCKPPGFTSRAPRECDRCGAIYTLAECSCSVLRPDYTPGTVTNTGVVQTGGDYMLPCKFCGTEVHASQWCPCDAQQAALKKWDALYEKKIGDPDHSALDRALSDFIARRKAKRDEAEALERSGAHIPYAETTRINRRSEALGRAVSLPLTFTARLGMKQP